MSDKEEIRISLSEAQLAALRSAVDAGEYATPEEIVLEAIRDWEVKRGLTAEDLIRFRQLWDEGIASGPAASLDFDEVRVEAASRLKLASRTAKFGR